MRILHLIQRFPPGIGGAEVWCEGVARHQAASGHAVEVLTLRLVNEEDLWDDWPHASSATVGVGRVDSWAGIRVRRCTPSRSPYGLLRAAETLGFQLAGRFSTELFGLGFAAARRADIVHVHQCNVVLSFAGVTLARLARRPVVITPHFHPGDPGYEQPPVRWLLRRCDAVIAVTPREATLFAERGVHPDRIAVSSNAIETSGSEAARSARPRVRRMLGLDSATGMITFLGRKSAAKDLPVLMEAAVRLGRRRDVALALVGPGSAWFSKQSADWHTRGVRLIDLAAIPEDAKRAVLAASDVVVQPSRYEAFGIVFLEAWAQLVPVVGAAAGAIPDVVADGGLTFAPGDAGDLADKVEWLLSHPEEATAMAARGRERVLREHTWDRVVAGVDRAYAIALGTRTAAAPLSPRVGAVP